MEEAKNGHEREQKEMQYGTSKTNRSGENYCKPRSLMGGNCTEGRND